MYLLLKWLYNEVCMIIDFSGHKFFVVFIVGIAKTGSGKTLAFVIPMLRHVLDQPSLDRDDGPIGILDK